MYFVGKINPQSICPRPKPGGFRRRVFPRRGLTAQRFCVILFKHPKLRGRLDTAYAGVAELADARDLKSRGRDPVPVRPRSPAPYRGVEQLVARRAHNPEVVGSSPTSATRKVTVSFRKRWLFITFHRQTVAAHFLATFLTTCLPTDRQKRPAGICFPAGRRFISIPHLISRNPMIMSTASAVRSAGAFSSKAA